MTLIKITKNSEIPLIGCLYFGIVDRGTNILQVRPNCSCNLSCPFCSVDAGPLSRTRTTTYEVEKEYLLNTVKAVTIFKGSGVECHIDSPGEPLLYPKLIDLVKAVKRIDGVRTVSMQTNGTLLNNEKIKAFEEAGLDRINLSIHSIEPDLAKKLAGTEQYEIGKVLDVARNIAESRIDLLIAPVFIPGINDQEIPKLIAFAKEIGAGKKWPPLGIQKFEKYKLGRTPNGVKSESWWQFFNRSIKEWEKKFNMKLILTAKDFGIEKRKMLPIVFDRGEKVKVDIQAPGWVKGEMLSIARDRVVSILNCPKTEGSLKVKILNIKHNIYVAVPFY